MSKPTIEEFKTELGRLNYEAEKSGETQMGSLLARYAGGEVMRLTDECKFHEERRTKAYDALVAMFTRALESKP